VSLIVISVLACARTLDAIAIAMAIHAAAIRELNDMRYLR
jgi:hypothetical protein